MFPQFVQQEQHSENQERNSLLRDTTKCSDDCGDITPNTHRELSAQCSSNDATTALSGDESDKPLEDSVDSATVRENYLQKRKFGISELVTTEEQYVKDLSQIVDGYLREMRNPDSDVPEDLKGGKDKMIFGNVEQIYEWHRE